MINVNNYSLIIGLNGQTKEDKIPRTPASGAFSKTGRRAATITIEPTLLSQAPSLHPNRFSNALGPNLSFCSKSSLKPPKVCFGTKAVENDKSIVTATRPQN